ncbi:MAG: response regulator transcription factor [Verrucomicrobia bacterium]|nr:response regulator transcription factor [Verrucomicrobiota bacterium]MBV8483062.1 response regulator transcription factor [Verrucomicrobiota bacterium]
MSSPVETVFVVDDELSVRKALSNLLRAAGLKVVTFDSAQAFLEHYDPRAPGCLVLDLAMPGLNGLELQQTLAAKGSLLPIIFLTGQGDLPSGVKAMKRGAVDFLSKPVDAADLIPAVCGAIEKDRLARRIDEELTEIRRRLALLTPREYEVLCHVVAGKLNKQIAADIGTVEKTVKVHRARVMEKVKAASLAELVRIAQRAGIQPL